MLTIGINILMPSTVCVNALLILTSVKLTNLIFSVVCVKLELNSALTLPVINIPSVVAVKLLSIVAIPASIPTPTEVLDAIPLISAVATCNTPPTSPNDASAMAA